jgi:hypothetical protein
MSTLVRDAIDAAGLADVLEARLRGAAMDGAMSRLRTADLLVLGALADRIRASESGDEVRIYVREPPAGETEHRTPEREDEVTGSELLREVALRRITGPANARVRVDWTRCGLELAQVALCFGADELSGTILTKAGDLIAEGELLGVGKKSRRELARDVKRRELAACVRRTGRVPLFVGPDGCAEREVDP